MAANFQKIEPQRGSIVIEPDVYADSTEQGIVILDDTKDVPQTGTVVTTHKSSQLKEGDIVCFVKHAGNSVQIKDKDCLLMQEDDILCVIPDDQIYPSPFKPGVVVKPIKPRDELIVLIKKKEIYTCAIVLKDKTRGELIRVGSYVMYETKNGNPLPNSEYEYITEPNIVAVSN